MMDTLWAGGRSATWKIAAAVAGVLVTTVVATVKRVGWAKLQASAKAEYDDDDDDDDYGGRGEGRGGGSSSSSPPPLVQILGLLAKGASAFQDHVGPCSITDLTLGLAAMLKMAEKQPPPPPGRLADEKMSRNPEFLACIQHWRAMAEAVYVCEASSFSLMTQLPESAVVHAEWNADRNTMRPAYVVCVDVPFASVVVSLRGTSNIADMLTSAGACPEAFYGGQAHGGYVKATQALLDEIQPHLLKAFSRGPMGDGAKSKRLKLVLVGHSMGGAIAIMAGMELRHAYPGLRCWSFSTPACVSHELASESAKFATSVVSAYDVVPRFSLVALEGLRKQLIEFSPKIARTILENDPHWKSVIWTIDTQEVTMGVCRSLREKFLQGIGWCQPTSKQSKDETPQPPCPAVALYPPGRLIVLVAEPPGCGKLPQSRSNVPQSRNFGAYPSFEESLHTKWKLLVAKHEEFLQLIVSPWSVSDHMLGNICEGIAYLQAQCSPLSLSSCEELFL